MLFPYKGRYTPLAEDPPAKRPRTDPQQDHQSTSSGPQTTTGTISYRARYGIVVAPLQVPITIVGLLRNRRYSHLPNRVTGCTSWPPGVCGELMSASKSVGAWNRQLSAVNSYSKFSLDQGFMVAWPIPIESLRAYVGWSLKTKKLTPSTVKQYLSDLKNFHLLRGLPTKHFDDFFLASMIRGAENMSLYANLTKQARLVMSFPLLKILGHEIATSNWSDESKRVFWGACCIAFFGSFRMGELLSNDEHQYSAETLTWNCVTFT